MTQAIANAVRNLTLKGEDALAAALALPAAKGNEELARKLVATGMSLGQVEAALKAAVPAKPAGSGQLSDRIASLKATQRKVNDYA